MTDDRRSNLVSLPHRSQEERDQQQTVVIARMLVMGVMALFAVIVVGLTVDRLS